MLVAILMESKADQDHAEKIASVLEDFGVKSEMYVASAHKVPEMVVDIVEDFNRSGEDLVYITISAASDGLSGMVAANSIHPVIACPHYKSKADYLAGVHSSTMYLKDVPSMLVIEPQNAAHAAIRILALNNDALRKKIARRIADVKDSF